MDTPVGPAWYPASPMACTSRASTSSGSVISGANPPSSPSPVDSLRPDSSRRSAAYTSAPARTASAIDGAPTGAIMNSWKSSELGACTPPLSTLKCGTGREGWTPSGVIHCHSGRPAEAASARVSAIEVPTVALAPSRLLFAVPSRSIMAWSASASEVQDRPSRRSRISVFTDATAPRTPLPSYLPGSPSRRSTASREPVEAPDGTPARAAAPSESRTVTASVGRPRESRISSADKSTTSNVAIICSCPGSPAWVPADLAARVSDGVPAPLQALAGQPAGHAEPDGETGRGQALGQFHAVVQQRRGDHVACLADPRRGRIRSVLHSVPVPGGVFGLHRSHDLCQLVTRALTAAVMPARPALASEKSMPVFGSVYSSL